MAAAAPCPVRTVSGFDPLSLSPRLLRCFVAVAEELHFGRAADRLYVAQPALSRSIQQLERMLDRPLFIRTTRSVALTSSATRLLPAAREILELLDQAAGDLALDRHALRVAHVAGYDTAALVLDQLVRGAPDVAVQEFAMSAAEQLRGVRDGELDAAVCPVRESLDRSLRGAIVRYDPLLVAMLGRHAESGRPVDPRHRTVCACDAGTEDADAAFLDEFEAASGCRLRRIPVAADSGTEAYALRRSGALAFVTPASRAIRLDSARALVGTVPLQAYQPWAIVWRRHDRSHLITSFLAAARQVALARRWLDLDALPGDSWLPATTPIAALITERNRSEPEWPLAA